jgi:hypothetical protein
MIIQVIYFLFLPLATPTVGPITYKPTGGIDPTTMIGIELPKFPNENGNIKYGYYISYFECNRP